MKPSSTAIVYRFFDEAERLLYVGITIMGPARWSEHAQHRPWWRDVATVRVTHFDTTEEAFAAEREAIQTEHPLHNRLLIRPLPEPVRRNVKRRGWAEGSIYQRQDGRWCAALRRYGARFVRYAESRDDAAKALRSLKIAYPDDIA